VGVMGDEARFEKGDLFACPPGLPAVDRCWCWCRCRWQMADVGWITSCTRKKHKHKHTHPVPHNHNYLVAATDRVESWSSHGARSQQTRLKGCSEWNKYSVQAPKLSDMGDLETKETKETMGDL
jgi:hypothetical protein